MCSGELQSNEYTDKEGNKRTSLSVIVSRFYWINAKKEMVDNAKQNTPKQDAPKEPEIIYEDSQAQVEAVQEDIPF